MPLNKQAMTLVEVLITVSLIALLAAFLLPAVSHAIHQRENGLAASRLRIAVNAFELYQSERGEYPADVGRGQIPESMIPYFSEFKIDEWWTQKTPVGGKWDWDKDNNFAYSVTIADPSATSSQMLELDKLLDDGDLSSGTLRQVGSRYHYIIKE